MKLQLQQCVSNSDQFDPMKSSSLEIGVEIQDFGNSQVLDGDWEERVRQYQKNSMASRG